MESKGSTIAMGVVGMIALILIVYSPKDATELQQDADVETSEQLDHIPFSGRLECRHGKAVLYTLDGITDFSAHPGDGTGWMWQFELDNGNIVFYQQSPNLMCHVIPE